MSETNVPITAGTGTPIDAFNSGASSALRQVIVLGDSVTTANIAKINSDGGLSVNGTQAAVSSVAWTSATTVNTANTINVTGYNTVSVAMSNTSTMTGGVLTFEVSPDNTNWFAISMARIDSYTVENTYTLNTVANRAWSTSVDGFTNFRVRLSTAITGTGTATVLVTPQTFAIEPIVSVGQSTASNLNATVTATNLSTNVAQVNGVTVATNSGTTTTGVARVVLSNDYGSSTLARLTASATGGATMFNLVSAATTNATSVKASAGTLYSLNCYNNGASTAYVKLYNKASAPTVGTDTPVKVIMLPAGGGSNVVAPAMGYSFTTGIAYAVTGLPANSDTTAVALSQVLVNGSYA